MRPDSKLTPVQQGVLEALAGVVPRFCLTGGAALAGFHLVDLVADAVPRIEPAEEHPLRSGTILVDSIHEILVNKLTTILNRAELRDLVDLKGLLARGGDLSRALREAPRKDGGFSPLTAAWVLRDLPISAMGKAADLAMEEIHDLEQFRDELTRTIAAQSAPDDG